ncbi:MAG: tetraacyldisaccharide 4'-kinase [Roseitalea porphyridii]
MRAPAFWRHDGALARLLMPAAVIYAAAVRHRLRAVMPHKAAVPVICVGNLVAGGAGKTPTAIAIADLLRELGRVPAFVTRGYKGRERGPLTVDPARHDWRAVGDEALLLARVAPTIVAADRPDGATLAIASGADALVLDDGFQNPSIAKDFSLLVIDADYGLGNGRVMPAGPLREPAADGFKRAEAVLRVAGLSGPPPGRPAWLPENEPLLEARLVPVGDAGAWTDRRVAAFAGIGRPEKFFQSLRDLGADLTETTDFPDHHAYAPDDVMRIVDRADAAGATPVTTAKDHVRLPPEARAMVEVLEVVLQFEEPGRLVDALRHTVAQHG